MRSGRKTRSNSLIYNTCILFRTENDLFQRSITAVHVEIPCKHTLRAQTQWAISRISKCPRDLRFSAQISFSLTLPPFTYFSKLTWYSIVCRKKKKKKLRDKFKKKNPWKKIGIVGLLFFCSLFLALFLLSLVDLFLWLLQLKHTCYRASLFIYFCHDISKPTRINFRVYRKSRELLLRSTEIQWLVYERRSYWKT